MDSAVWKRDLWVCSFGSVTTLVCMTAILPFLPTMIMGYGVYDTADISRFSAYAYSATFFSAALTAPLWGKLSDRFGRKPMLLRASVGMCAMTALLPFAHSPTELILCRLFLGILGGYASSATALIAVQSPKDKAGWALGVLSACIMTGNVIGPLIGGILSAHIGYRATLLLCASLVAITFIATLFIRETKISLVTQASQAHADSPKYSTPIILSLYSLTIILAISILSIEPILPLLVAQFHTRLAVETVTGIIFSLGSLGAVLSAPQLGKLADKKGNLPVICGCLLAASLFLYLQSWVHTPYELGMLRLCTGLCLGGLLPCIVSELKNNSPPAIIGRITSINISCQYAGQVLGPVIGASIAQTWGFPAVFTTTALITLTGAAITRTLITHQPKKHKPQP